MARCAIPSCDGALAEKLGNGLSRLRQIPHRGTKPIKYFVYVLKSMQNRDLYVGSTADVERRFRLHNAGRVKSTKGYRPWILVEVRDHISRAEAVREERFLKTGQQKELLRKKYC